MVPKTTVSPLTIGAERPAAGRAGQWRRLLLEAAPEGAPVVTGLPFGHGADNRAFPIGAVVELDTRRGRVTWR
jgi:muramoyltetrapeptide carboxypeptidase LdcA involved in peptidoglycan recycling